MSLLQLLFLTHKKSIQRSIISYVLTIIHLHLSRHFNLPTPYSLYLWWYIFTAVLTSLGRGASSWIVVAAALDSSSRQKQPKNQKIRVRSDYLGTYLLYLLFAAFFLQERRRLCYVLLMLLVLCIYFCSEFLPPRSRQVGRCCRPLRDASKSAIYIFFSPHPKTLNHQFLGSHESIMSDEWPWALSQTRISQTAKELHCLSLSEARTLNMNMYIRSFITYFYYVVYGYVNS